jgi:hypothetical protein
MAMSLTSRSVRELKKEYPLVQIVETYNYFTKRRHDLFGILDILCVREQDILGVQTTSRGNMSSRVKKIEDSDAIATLRDANILIHVHGWDKYKNRWRLKVLDIS